jgi:hypothetical protein
MNLTIPRIGGIHYKGGKDVEIEMVKKCMKINT